MQLQHVCVCVYYKLYNLQSPEPQIEGTISKNYRLCGVYRVDDWLGTYIARQIIIFIYNVHIY